MKLVEILGKEMSEWPEGFEDVGQACDGVLHLPGIGNHVRHTKERYTKSEDWAGAIVTRAQWQAERDRQKGGEWKRHRGGKCPVPAGTKVSTRHRDGEVVDVHFQTAEYGTHKAVMDCVWKHSGRKHDIMAYKVISQPQAEHTDWVGPFPCATSDSAANEIELAISYPAGVCSVESKTEQIEGPIKWRDQIVELEAHAEDIQREIASLFAKLNSEGFQLIRQYPSLSTDVPAVDMSDWRNWKRGDIVEVIIPNDGGLPIGKQYTVCEIEAPDYDGGMMVKVFDDEGESHWPKDDKYEGRTVFKFIRRP